MEFKSESGRIYAENADGTVVAQVTFAETEKGVFSIDSTFVDDSLRGRGIAAQLVSLAAEKIESQGGRVTASCSYAKRWLEKNMK